MFNESKIEKKMIFYKEYIFADPDLPDIKAKLV